MRHRSSGRILLAVVFFAAAAAAHAQSRPDPFVARLPDGEGKQATIDRCAGACHGADHFANAHRTPDEWRKTVLQMVSNGAQLFPEDIDAVTKYLSAYLGPKASAPAAAH